MTGWDEHGHARPTGLPVDRYLGSGDLQDAENCGYAPVAVLRELGVDYAYDDPQIQFRDGRIVLTDGTVLERGGALGCVWAVTRLPAADHSGVAGEPKATEEESCSCWLCRDAEAREAAATDAPTPGHSPDPVIPSVELSTGCVVVSDGRLPEHLRGDGPCDDCGDPQLSMEGR